jgi:hypothetical protein
LPPEDGNGCDLVDPSSTSNIEKVGRAVRSISSPREFAQLQGIAALRGERLRAGVEDRVLALSEGALKQLLVKLSKSRVEDRTMEVSIARGG